MKVYCLWVNGRYVDVYDSLEGGDGLLEAIRWLNTEIKRAVFDVRFFSDRESLEDFHNHQIENNKTLDAMVLEGILDESEV